MARHGLGLAIALSCIPAFFLASGISYSFDQAIRFSHSTSAIWSSGATLALVLLVHLGVAAFLAGLITRQGKRFVPVGWWVLSLALSFCWLAVIGYLYGMFHQMAQVMATSVPVGPDLNVTSTFWHAGVFLLLTIGALAWTRKDGRLGIWIVGILVAACAGPVFVGIALYLGT